MNIAIFRLHYRGAPVRDLKDASLESLTLDFEQNLAVIAAKARWLSFAVHSLGAQALALIALIIERAV